MTTLLVTAAAAAGASGSHAGSNAWLWILWGGLGIFFCAIYMGVYVLIRTRWRHRARGGAPDLAGTGPDPGEGVATPARRV
jgi:hypothetical protein